MITTISNPPYNIKWKEPIQAKTQERFSYTEVPPESNANFAFILTALDISDRCVFILPCGVLSTSNKKEKEIMKYLIESNFIESVITCPDKTFEKTSIPTCIIVFDKHKKTSTIELLDMRNIYEVEAREQNGQFGGNSHTKRVYKKEIKVFTDQMIDEAISCIEERKNIAEYCKSVSIEDVKKHDYVLIPSRYINFVEQETLHREYKDIVNDLNRVIREKNNCKLTINETLAKNLGFDIELYKLDHAQDKELNDLVKQLSGEKIEKHNYFSTTKNKNEIKFENNSKENLSSILMMIFQMWKQHLYFLNIEENRYLTELKDALLPDLMNGKIIIGGKRE